MRVLGAARWLSMGFPLILVTLILSLLWIELADRKHKDAGSDDLVVDDTKDTTSTSSADADTDDEIQQGTDERNTERNQASGLEVEKKGVTGTEDVQIEPDGGVLWPRFSTPPFTKGKRSKRPDVEEGKSVHSAHHGGVRDRRGQANAVPNEKNAQKNGTEQIPRSASVFQTQKASNKDSSAAEGTGKGRASGQS